MAKIEDYGPVQCWCNRMYGKKNLILRQKSLSNTIILCFKPFNYQKADNKIFVCRFSKKFKSKLYHIENLKTRGQTG